MFVYCKHVVAEQSKIISLASVFCLLEKNENTHAHCITRSTLQGKDVHWNLSFAIFLLANSLDSNSAYYYNFRNLSMIAYIIEI